MMVGGESSGKSGSQDFELNLASIIDCLTVLIAFMLASASFLSISVLDAGVAAAGPQMKDTPPPAVSVTVELGKENAMTVRISGKSNSTQKLSPKNGEWDFEGLTQNLANVKSRWPDVNAVILNADNAVEYKHVVKMMESIRKTMPAVMLGGF